VKVLHGSYSATAGGAARAAFRVHQALRGAGVDSSMLVVDAADEEAGVFQVPGRGEIRHAKSLIERRVMRLQNSENPILHSPALLPGGAGQLLRHSDADVINLHWIAGGYLSIEQVGTLLRERPVVWRLPDMWPFCGAEHYSEAGDPPRYVTGYERCSPKSRHAGLDVDRWVWLRKRRSWTRPVQIITPTTWLRDCVRHSELLGEWPVTAIPNPLDLQRFRPRDPVLSRELLNLPQDVPLVLFGAVGGTSQPIKGWDLLKEALAVLSETAPEFHLAVFGQKGSDELTHLPYTVHPLGILHDDVSLALAYSAADVMIVPSRIEGFGQTASEAQACGTPVVAFQTSGLTDVVAHGKTGYLASMYDTEELAYGIEFVLREERRLGEFGLTARSRAEMLWDSEAIARQYFQVYEKAIVPD